MPLFKNRKSKERFTRVFTIVFAVVFILSIAGGLIIANIRVQGTPVPIETSTP